MKRLSLFLGVIAASALLSGAELVVKRPGKLTQGVAIFPEVQCDYTCANNFCYPPAWNDRPLFLDRACRKQGTHYEKFTPQGVSHELSLVRKFQLNGLSLLGSTPDMRYILDFCAKEKMQGFLLLPGSYAMKIKNMNANVKPKNFEEMARLADSPYVFKINGKMVINAYESTLNTPEQWKKLLASVREKYGDKFLYVADMKIVMQLYRYRFFEFCGRSSPPELEKEIEDKIQSYLDVCDGIQVYPANGCHSPDGAYGIHLEKDYIQAVNKLIRRIMAKPQNCGKILASTASIGYINPSSGSVSPDENGTATLRTTLEAALALDPDYIVPFEWNEWNENTCVLPTVRKGTAACRIMRYYLDAANNRKLTPLAGDDTTIPNLVLSCRASLKYGEKLHFEVLNIPDGTGKGKCTCTITLRDENGKSVFTSQPLTLDLQAMAAKDLRLPTENFSANCALVPELDVTTADNRKLHFANFPPIILNANSNVDYLYTRLPLRDTLKVDSELRITEEADGSYRVQGKITSPETLSQVEILDRHNEIAAIGDTEYDLRKEAIFRVTNSSLHWVTFRGALTVANAPGARLRWSQIGGRACVLNDYKLLPNGLRINLGMGGHNHLDCLLAVPRSELDKAELRFDGTIQEHNGKDQPVRPCHFAIRIADAVAAGASGVEIEPACRWGVEVWNTEPDIAYPLNKKEIAFDQIVRSDETLPLFSMRAVSKDGRRWQSVLFPQKKLSGKSVLLPVYSEARKEVIPLSVDASRIPDLNYRFDSRSGNFLVCGTMRALNGELGGGYNGDRSNYKHILPRSVRSTAPQWVKNSQDGTYLHFDGIAQSISFWVGVWPIGSFTVDFSIRPEKGDFMLLRSGSGNSIGAVSLYAVNGKLLIGSRFADANHRFTETPLDITPGIWNDIQLASDLKNFYVTVNGKTWVGGKAGRGFNVNALAFGGDINKGFRPKQPVKFFAGDLRSLRIRHGFFPDAAVK